MRLKTAATILLIAFVVAFSSTASASIQGAIWTTDVACGGVDLNIYVAKSDVYLNGGPHGGNGLNPGNYWVKVTTPAGDLLGYSTSAVAVVGEDGRFAQCYQLNAILVKASDGTPGYDNTTNGGGEYKVWVDNKDNTFTPSDTKTDNFKAGPDVPACDPNTPELCECDNDPNTPNPDCQTTDRPDTSDFIGYKFYDANANGVWDDGEVAIAGWPVSMDGGTPQVTDQDGRFEFIIDSDGAPHTFAESAPLGGFNTPGGSSLLSPWVVNLNGATRTANAGGVGDGDVIVDVLPPFGNFCVGGGNGHTIGFWGNKNGNSLLDSADFAALSALNLRNANGTDFNPGGVAAWNKWLASATATNMAYMLSAQMSATFLSTTNNSSVYKVGVDPNAFIYALGSNSVNAGGFAQISALLTEANTELGLHGSTVAAGATRDYQTTLKNIFDAANNNANVYIQSSSCALPTTFQ